jgi:pentose-5-phosphate-3-epimerase
MAVEPGFPVQPFDERIYERVVEMDRNSQRRNFLLGVDGRLPLMM